MTFTAKCNKIFNQSIADYHINDNVDFPINNPYEPQTIEYYLYLKNWIDTVQWHLEDIIRDPNIDPINALALKRRIDKSNQERTDLVEMIDSYFWEQYSSVEQKEGARLNTESPAWAVDRLSILQLKIYHMRVETERKDTSKKHHNQCAAKLKTLEDQNIDITTAIDQLMDEYAAGTRVMKVYKQMKMYNDPSLNPVLYDKK